MAWLLSWQLTEFITVGSHYLNSASIKFAVLCQTAEISNVSTCKN